MQPTQSEPEWRALAVPGNSTHELQRIARRMGMAIVVEVHVDVALRASRHRQLANAHGISWNPTLMQAPDACGPAVELVRRVRAGIGALASVQPEVGEARGDFLDQGPGSTVRSDDR